MLNSFPVLRGDFEFYYDINLHSAEVIHINLAGLDAGGGEQASDTCNATRLAQLRGSSASGGRICSTLLFLVFDFFILSSSSVIPIPTLRAP